MVSSWRRPRGLASTSRQGVGSYLNSALAKFEADACGAEVAIILDAHGNVSEGTAENVFVLCDGVLTTPPLGSDVLAGITRHTVMALAQGRGIRVHERQLARAELALADEAIVTGTAAEITALREVDGHQLRAPGPVTATLIAAYDDLVRGRDARRSEWLTPIAR